MLDNSGIYAFKDRGSDVESSDAPEVAEAETGTLQNPLNSMDNGSLPLSGAAEPDDLAAPATDADTSITVASNSSVTANTQRTDALGSFSSADEANEIFGSETNANFLMLAVGAASQTPLNFFGDGDNAVFGSTSPGAEAVQKEKNSAALPAERPRNLMGAGAPETNTLSSSIYPARVAPAIFSTANETNTPSISSSTDVAAQAPAAAPSVTVAAGAAEVIDGASGQSVTFAGSTGTLILNDALAFTGQVSGLAGSDAIDLADVSYGSSTQVTFLGNTDGGTLTITNGTETTNIDLVGDYLSSYWDLSSDGNGGTVVVDPTPANSWQPINIGAGGFITGMDIAPDGTMVVRDNVYGAYIWNGTQWQQLVTSASMPAAFVAPLNNQGVYDIQIAPSNSNIMYMMYEGYVFESSNKGTTWTETSFTPVTANANDGNYDWYGQRIAIDPNNPDVVYVGTPFNGLFVTTNGGASWQSVSGVPASQLDGSGDAPGFAGILFDPANTNIIFAASYGNGVYESTNGGSSWSSLLSGGPSSVSYAAISSTGVYYAVSTNQEDLWAYTDGTWRELISGVDGQGSVNAVAVNPSNPNEIIAIGVNGQIDESLNGGTTWSGWTTKNSLSATDAPWQDILSPYLGTSALFFNPLDSNELLASGGNDFFNITLSGTITTSTSVVWIAQGVGIEELVSNEVIVPPGGNPIFAAWDRPLWDVSNPNVAPSTYGPVATTVPYTAWSVDYASSDPSFIVALVDNSYYGGTGNESGYSTNGGQTWTLFPTDPPGGSNGGTIAASTSSNVIWASASGVQPYYTLNGGETWSPVVLPGVSSWSNFDTAYFYDTRTVTADRVLPNTFYLYYPGYGVYESTNGGVSWTQVSNIDFSGSGANSELQSVPGEAGNLFWSSGPLGGQGSQEPVGAPFYQSTNGGATWTAVPNVLDVNCFGFGAPAPGQSYPTIYIVGWVNGVYGIWQSYNDARSWTQIGTYPDSSLDAIKTISGDPNIFGQVYIGFAGSGFAYLPGGPAVSTVAASPSSGIEVPGNTITFTLTMNEVATVSGTPTLSLNDGGTATYIGGSGTDALTFSYTVSASNSDVAALAITQINLPNSAMITDSSGNAANLSLAWVSQSGPQIITGPPTVMSVAESPSSGVLSAGNTVTLTLNLSEVVTVSGGTPTLTLNDGGTATYTGGSGTSALTFSSTVAAGQNAADLTATVVNLNGATITDVVGNAANLSLTGLSQTGPEIITSPVATSVVATGSGITAGASDLGAGDVVTLTVNLNEAAAVTGGTPTLTLNDGGTATYTGGSDTTSLTFSYTVAAGQNTSALGVTAVNLNGATVTNDATVTAGSGGSLTDPNGNVWSFGASAGSGNYDILCNGVEFDGGAGTTLALVNGVIWTENSASRWFTAIGTGWVAQSTGPTTLAVNFTNAVTTLAGPLQIDTTSGSGPTISSIVESPSSGDLNAGKTVTLTLDMSEVVTVNTTGGSSTLSLNDGGTATYVSGSGTSTLVFSYTAAASQNTSDLAVTAVNLNNATIEDGSGNAASLSLTGLTQTGPQIDTTTPLISAIAKSPSSGDLDAGKTVTYTLSMSEVVTVNTTGGSPTLSLNDGGTATYVSGTGTSTLTFSYTVLAGQNTPDLTVSAVNLNGATIADGGGNVANLSLSGLSQGSPQIDTTPPTISSVTATAGDYDAGKALTLTLHMSEAVNVTGTPTLTLSDGGTASYVSGTGTSTLTFSYTVAASQNTTALQATAVTGTITDLAGNALSTHRPAGDRQRRHHRHHGADGIVGDGDGGRLRYRPGTDADAQHERGGQCHRHADAHAQRWWHCQLCQRLWLQRAGIQLHRACWSEYRRAPGDDGHWHDH